MIMGKSCYVKECNLVGTVGAMPSFYAPLFSCHLSCHFICLKEKNQLKRKGDVDIIRVCMGMFSMWFSAFLPFGIAGR